MDYSNRNQVVHSSPDGFDADLRKVWRNANNACVYDAKMIIRFGGFANRGGNLCDLINMSLDESGWKIKEIREAGPALEGKQQSDTFLRTKTESMMEYDIWTIKSWKNKFI